MRTSMYCTEEKYVFAYIVNYNAMDNTGGRDIGYNATKSLCHYVIVHKPVYAWKVFVIVIVIGEVYGAF